ncbi:unnamed protein product [Mycena citricolor]|uniref:Uncharacterized protein n=1 Tax=Mycena citricolor TaxID=2018698 RepID=A0AAD2HCQ1_9AGAR|nr:unnamed protein product [Mycena citricolor]
MSATTNTNMTNNNSDAPNTKVSIGTKFKGGAKVAQGLGDTIRGTTMGAIDAVERRDSAANDEMVRKGRMEIEEGISMIKGRAYAGQQGLAGARVNNGPGESLQGWGSGINGANPEATTNATGFAPPKGAEYAQNSTTNAPSDLGRGPNAYSGNNTNQPPTYLAGGPPVHDYKSADGGAMGYTSPTQMGNRPQNDVGESEYEARREAGAGNGASYQ